MVKAHSDQARASPQSHPEQADEPALDELVKYFAETLAERDFARIVENERGTLSDQSRRRDRS